jgi:hypothetical protein
MRKSISIPIFVVFFLFFASHGFAESSSIESLSKIRTSRGYVFKINYKTEEEWTDGVIFKIFCSFNKGAELSFVSAGQNNIKKGWHQTEIFIQNVYRERYGFIRDYRVEMYHNGMLVSLKSL